MKHVKPHIVTDSLLKGRGAQLNTHNSFQKSKYVQTDDPIMWWQTEEMEEKSATTYIEVFPKNILSRNNSPDIPFDYSINPYNGCEHGCVYCYARNSHEYWGYSAGRDFEEKILYKPKGHEMLRQLFRSGKWEPQLIVLSGNTDCYQPAERDLQLTRQLLQVFLEHKHPVGLITKNSLILRDLDILKELARLNLVGVTISITTLQEEIRRTMEPRTSSVANRLRAVEELSQAGIPVNVNMAPIIPGINSDEIFSLVEAVSQRGAVSVQYIMARLNGQIAMIFEDWVKKAMPERAEKVLAIIKETHGGSLNESRWKTRMSGEGHFANHVASMFRVARKKFLPEKKNFELDYSHFVTNTEKQLTLF
jgi:DNA repair photolyase